MIAVSLDNLSSLVAQIGCKPFVLFVKTAPYWQFGLEIDAEVVGCFEASLGRAP